MPEETNRPSGGNGFRERDGGGSLLGPNNLPAARSGFVGLEREMAEIRGALSSARGVAARPAWP